MEEIQAWNLSLYDIVYKDVDAILEDIKCGEINYFEIKERFIPGNIPNSYLEEKENSKNRIVLYTDEMHPLIGSSISDEYIMNPYFFTKYRTEIIEALLENIKNSKRKYYQIPNYLYSEELLDYLITIDDVTLIFYDVKLSDSAIKKLKNKYILAKLITDGKEEMISSNVIIGGVSPHTIKEIKGDGFIQLDVNVLDEISDDIITKINDLTTISFTTELFTGEEEFVNFYEKAFRFMERADKLGKTFEVILKAYPYRRYFNQVFGDRKFNNLNIIIHSSGDIYSYQEYIEEEKVIKNILSPLEGKELSPLEKYLAVYNIVKTYKAYKETPNNKEEARNLKYILNNDYIVCLGFSNLLKALCDEVGINVTKIGVTVDLSYDDGYTMEEKIVVDGYHSRCIVSIDDDKYNVHGLYMTDPTWDNDLENNSLNHALMTFDKMQVGDRMFNYSIFAPILDIHNFLEFNEQVNYLLKQYIKSSTMKNFSFDEILLREYDRLIENIMNSIDCDLKYYYFRSLRINCKTEIDYKNLLTELGHYLLTRINQKVDDEIILKAALYADRVLEKDNDEDFVRRYYYERDKEIFPYEVDKENEHNLIERNK